MATPPSASGAPGAVDPTVAGAATRLHTLVLASMSEGVSVSDASGVIVYTNPAEDRMFGYAPGELVGQHVTVQNAYPPEENARRVAQVIAELHATGSWDGEWENVRKDGTRFATRARITALELDGRPHWVCVQEDVTARRAAEAARLAALDDSERAREEVESARAVASALIDSVRDAFVAYDAEFRFTYVNAAAAALFRATGAGDALIGRELWAAYPHLVGTPVETAMREAMTARVPVSFDSNDPERRRWFAARVYPTADGGLSAVWTDVTAERRAAEANALLAAASDVLVASLDVERTLAGVARLVATTMADYCVVHLVESDAAAGDRKDAAPAVGRLRLLAVAHADPDRAAAAHALETRYPLPADAPVGAPSVVRTGLPSLQPELPWSRVEAAARDATHLALLRTLGLRSTIVVPLIARGHTIGALTLAIAESERRYDATDLATAEELARRAALAVDNARLYAAAEAARGAAEAANRAKSEFLAVMSHELRTPLNAIGGYAELLELGIRGPVTAEQRADLERIQRSQRHLLGLINGVLNYARVEAGALHYDIADVPVDEVLATCEALVAPQVRTRGLGLRFVGCDPALHARADREKLQQVLLNLLTNAVKFTAPGGHIDLACAVADGTVRITVTDTGRGIAAEHLERVFEPFVQVDASRTRMHEGTGLGLAISRDLARGMGGDLTAESTLDVGSTFTLTLPVADRG